MIKINEFKGGKRPPVKIKEIFYVTSIYFFTISTLRFFALPSSVRLSATGFSWPQPTYYSEVEQVYTISNKS
jgi:hypothetical protein